MQRSRPLSTVIASCILAISGCSANRPGVDYDLVFVTVKPMDYARMLCRPIPMHERHTCMTSVIEHYQANTREELPPDEVVNGPFVVLIDNQTYRGTYVSQPLAAAFTVGNGWNVCRGRYDAIAGDTEPTFRVWCTDGERGHAKIVLDQTGSNGIGRIWMDDGSEGDIVFGYAAAGGLSL